MTKGPQNDPNQKAVRQLRKAEGCPTASLLRVNERDQRFLQMSPLVPALRPRQTGSRASGSRHEPTFREPLLRQNWFLVPAAALAFEGGDSSAGARESAELDENVPCLTSTSMMSLCFVTDQKGPIGLSRQ